MQGFNNYQQHPMNPNQGFQQSFQQAPGVTFYNDQKKEVKTSYSLNDTNKWATFPELQVQLQLQMPTSAFIQYNITTQTQGNSHICTRLMINDIEHSEFRHITGDGAFHSNSASSFVNFPAGNHVIKV